MNELLNNLYYAIPGFNGYFINTDGVVKSMKMFKKYPNGIFLKYRHKDGNYYELSNDKNKRIRKKVNELLDLVINSRTIYVINDKETFCGSRNKGYMNYNYHHPNNEGTAKIDIFGKTEIIPLQPKLDNIILKFPFEIEEKKSECMVVFY